ncbi:MAG: twin-arginine translocation signal domain-containing protein [Acidimicrobiales bacterium]
MTPQATNPASAASLGSMVNRRQFLGAAGMAVGATPYPIPATQSMPTQERGTARRRT